MFALEEMVVKRLTEKTGFPMTVGSMSGNFLSGRFRFGDVVVGNPGGYPLRDFISVVEATVHVSPGSLLSRSIRIRTCSVHLRRLTGIRSATGAVNIEQFREALERREPGDTRASGDRSRSREIHIARLTVKVDHIATVDFSGRGEGRRDYPILFEQEFRDVREIISLGSPLVEHCDAAGLSHETDSIFATLLPGFLWERIGQLEW